MNGHRQQHGGSGKSLQVALVEKGIAEWGSMPLGHRSRFVVERFVVEI